MLFNQFVILEHTTLATNPHLFHHPLSIQSITSTAQIDR